MLSNCSAVSSPITLHGWIFPTTFLFIHMNPSRHQDDGDGLLVTRLKVHLLQQAFSGVPQALRCLQEVLRRLWKKELRDVPLVLPATLQNLERTIEDEECTQALACYLEPIHCHVCLGQPVCIDEGSLKKFNCGGVLQRPGEWRGVDHPATKVCQNKTLYPVKIKIADRVKKGKSANLKMKKISWAQCLVPRGEGLHKGS